MHAFIRLERGGWGKRLTVLEKTVFFERVADSICQ
jgi:hypothetical protein